MKKVSIVGLGRFGRTLYELLKDDFEIIIYDKKKNSNKGLKLGKKAKVTTKLNEVYESDTIFFCVPVSSFEEVIAEHSKYLNDSHLLIDVLSVKQFPADVFRRYTKKNGAQAILTDPMFGPESSASGFEGLPIVMDRFTASKGKYDFWKKFFKSKGLKVIEMKPKEHDKLTARSRGVTHFIGRLLGEFGFKKTKIDTVGAQKLHEVQDQTCHDTWEFFLDLQNYNPYTKQMRINLGQAYDRLYNRLLPDRISKDYVVYGIQGGVGSFNHEAILGYTKDHGVEDYKIKYLYTSDSVLRNLHVGSIDFGLFAMHNSIGGVVQESIKAVADYTFEIVEEFAFPVRHFMMKRKDVDFAEVESLMAHPQVYKQCQGTLAKKYPDLPQKVGKGDLIDHAAVARALSKGMINKNIAVIGPKTLSELYDLEVVAENLQDMKDNVTSFMLVKRK